MIYSFEASDDLYCKIGLYVATVFLSAVEQFFNNYRRKVKKI